MFGRSAKFQFKSDKLNELEAQIPGVRDKLKSLGGLIDCYLAWDANGAGITMVIYDTQASADAAYQRFNRSGQSWRTTSKDRQSSR